MGNWRRRVVWVAAAGAVVAGCNLGEAPTTYPGFGGALDAADLDNDGDIDLVANDCEELSVLLNDGAGGFSPSESTGPHCAANGALGDVDGDGNVDRVQVENDRPYTITLHFGDGAGGFGGPAWTFVPEEPSDFVRAVALGDVDGDGQADLVYQESPAWQGRYSVHLAGDASAWFQPAVHYDDGYAHDGYVASTVVLRDLDGDGDLDVASSGTAPPYDADAAIVSASLNDGTGAFPTPTAQIVAITGEPVGWAATSGLVVADVDEDGTLDLVTTASYSDAEGISRACLAVLRGDGAGGFLPRECVAAPSETYGALGDDENSADVDGDGHVDLVTTRGVLFGDGTGRFARFRGLAARGSAVTADFDGDGRPDVAISAGGATAVTTVFLNRLTQ